MKSGTKKITKLLSVLMVVCMFMSLGSAAFAANQGDYGEPALPVVTITAGKTFTVDTASNLNKLTNAQFTLTAEGYTGDVTGTIVPMPGVTTVTASLSGSGTSKTGSAAFSAITYTTPGIYTYKLVENVTTPVPGVTYDTADRYINVYVTNMVGSNGSLMINDSTGLPYVEVSAITVWKGTNAALNWSNPAGDSSSNPAKVGSGNVSDKLNGKVKVDFINAFGASIDPNNPDPKNVVLEVEKEVKGTLGNPNQEFPFTFYTNSSNALAYQVFNAAGTALTGSGKVGTITSPGTYNFNLKNGDYVRVYNLADGDTYTVTERTDSTTNTYATTISGVAGGNTLSGVSNVTTGTKSVGAQTFSISALDRQLFVNSKGATPPTGIAMDVLPFVLMVVIAGFGIAAIVLKKRQATAE